MADFSKYNPATSIAVQEFEDGLGGSGVTNVLDFGKGYEKSRWNKTILTKLCHDLLVEHESDGTWNVPDISNDYLMALFYGQLKKSREAWSLVQLHPNIEAGHMETIEEVSRHIEEYTEDRLTAVGSRAR